MEQTYRENGVTEELLNANIDKICENAVKDPCTSSNPRPIDVENMKKVLLCAFNGDDVTF